MGVFCLAPAIAAPMFNSLVAARVLACRQQTMSPQSIIWRLLLTLWVLMPGTPGPSFAQQKADPSLPWVTPAAPALRVQRVLQSATVGAPVSYHVYLPRAYETNPDRLPVLYWLHGTEGGIAGIAPLSRHFDEAIEAGRYPAMIVVFVNGLPVAILVDAGSGSASGAAKPAWAAF